MKRHHRNTSSIFPTLIVIYGMFFFIQSLTASAAGSLTSCDDISVPVRFISHFRMNNLSLHVIILIRYSKINGYRMLSRNNWKKDGGF